MCAAVLLSAFCAGCIADQGGPEDRAFPGAPGQGTADNTTGVVPVRPSLTPSPSGSPDPAKAVTPPTLPGGHRTALPVLRGEPFAINGTTGEFRAAEVEIWVLRDPVATAAVPVMPDGSFRFELDGCGTAAIPRQTPLIVVVQYPSGGGTFGIVPDNRTGSPAGLRNGTLVPLSGWREAAAKGPGAMGDLLTAAISRTGGSSDLWYLAGQDARILIDPIGPSRPGSLRVTGTTSLPAGTPLSVSVVTANLHPTPKNYDWSHEMADGDGTVAAGSGRNRSFTGLVDTSLLNTGRYLVTVQSDDDAWQAEATATAAIIAAQSMTRPADTSTPDWQGLSVRPPVVDGTMVPVLLDDEWRVVPPETGTRPGDLPYGSVIWCRCDGICRVFDRSGNQTLAVYDSNAARMMEVPNGAAIDSRDAGRVTVVSLDRKVILTKVQECPAGA